MDIDGPLQSKLGLQSRAKLGAFIESDGFFGVELKVQGQCL